MARQWPVVTLSTRDLRDPSRVPSRFLAQPDRADARGQPSTHTAPDVPGRVRPDRTHVTGAPTSSNPDPRNPANPWIRRDRRPLDHDAQRHENHQQELKITNSDTGVCLRIQ